MHSPYMQWAKTHAHVRFNLQSSGLKNYALADLPGVKLAELEITGDSYYGYPPLQQALARHTGVTPDRIFATLGTSMANFVALSALFAPGDEVLIEQPTYELITAAAEHLGLSVRRFRRPAKEGYIVSPGEVERALSPRTKGIILTNLHNPSSAFTGEETLRAIGELARSRGALVVVDEVYLDGAWGVPHRSAVHLGGEFVATNSLTKIYGLSGLRCGWVSARPDLIARMWHVADMMYGIPAHPAEQLSVVALEHLDHIGRWSREILDANHRSVRELILGRNDLEICYHGSGTVIFPKLLTGTVDRLYAMLMERYEAAVAPGRFFEEPEHFRIGLGGAPETCRSGLERLSSALDELRRR